MKYGAMEQYLEHPKATASNTSLSQSPKLSRPKETQVPIPSGSGLLSGSVFSNGTESTAAKKVAPTIFLNVPLTGDNQYINFTRLVEERYGFNALHPRVAAQCEGVAHVAAVGSTHENARPNGSHSGSDDSISVDPSDGEADNNIVDEGAANGGESIQKTRKETGEADGAKERKKRMTKEYKYGKEDDFIEDTEMVREEQVAPSKDGFFVYSGPLVPPGQVPQVERYEPLISSLDHVPTDCRADCPPKRGRGSGRGPAEHAYNVR